MNTPLPLTQNTPGYCKPWEMLPQGPSMNVFTKISPFEQSKIKYPIFYSFLLQNREVVYFIARPKVNAFQPVSNNQITVKATQPGPPNIFKPITRQVQNKRIRVFLTRELSLVCNQGPLTKKG